MANRIFAEDILQGKIAFVTGGGTGITGGVARAFARHGAKLAITSRKIESLKAMKELIENEDGSECIAVAGDVRDFAFPAGPFTHVIHAATEASAKLDAEAPLTMFDVIVTGTRRTLDFAVQAGAGRML